MISHLGRKVLNTFLPKRESQNFHFSRPPLLLTPVADLGYRTSGVTLSKELPTCAIDDAVKPTVLTVQNSGFIIPTTQNRYPFKIFITKSIP